MAKSPQPPRSGGRHVLCPSSVVRCCRAWSHLFTAPAPTSSGRPAVPASWHGCQVGAKNLAQVPFSLARDTVGGRGKDLAEDRRDQGVVGFIGCYATVDNRELCEVAAFSCGAENTGWTRRSATPGAQGRLGSGVSSRDERATRRRCDRRTHPLPRRHRRALPSALAGRRIRPSTPAVLFIERRRTRRCCRCRLTGGCGHADGCGPGWPAPRPGFAGTCPVSPVSGTRSS